MESSYTEEVAILEDEMLKLELEAHRDREKSLGTSDLYSFDYSGDTKPHDVICLNIRGTKTKVLRSTLTWVKGTMLSAQFSGRWDDSIEKDNDGNFVIDHEYALFRPILTFLRSRKVEYFDDEMKSEFITLAESFGLAKVMIPRLLFDKFTCDEDVNYEIVGLRAKQTSGTCGKESLLFELVPPEHVGSIKSFSIAVSMPRISIKLYETPKYNGEYFSLHLCPTRDRRRINLVADWPYEIGGLGYYAAYRRHHLNNAVNVEDPDDIVVIKMQDFGRRWSINGGTLVESVEFERHSTSRHWASFQIENFGGDFEITSCEFETKMF